MKYKVFIKTGILFFSFALLFPSLSALSEEDPSIHLNLPEGFFSQVCPSPIWKNLKIRWLGVTDERPHQWVGIVTKKGGKNPVRIETDQPLTETFNASLKTLFTQCGMILTDAKENPSASPEATLAVKIIDFSATEEKRFFTGKGTAKSRLLFLVQEGRKKTTSTVGYGLEFKMGRKSGIKRMQMILSELYQATLKEIPKAAELRKIADKN